MACRDMGPPIYHRMTYLSPNSTPTLEEVVLRVQGFISGSDLPPFKPERRDNKPM